jgi:signal transduction histidine kinase
VFRDARQVTLQVLDHGRGISPGVLKPRDHHARVVVGVGIAGMRERVRQLGGQLQIESGDNGTLLRATLPVPEVASLPEHENDRGDAGALRASSKDTVANE